MLLYVSSIIETSCHELKYFFIKCIVKHFIAIKKFEKMLKKLMPKNKKILFTWFYLYSFEKVKSKIYISNKLKEQRYAI